MAKTHGVRARARGLGLALLLGSTRLLAQQAEAAPSVEALPPPPVDESTPVKVPVPATSAPLATEPYREWYGWQLMISDFVALGALGGAALAGVKGNAVFAVVVPVALVYDFGGPTIHWLHRRRAIAGASLGVRIGTPFIGVLVGDAVAGCTDEGLRAKTCKNRGAGYGALLGFAAATAIDAALFGWDAPREPMRQSSSFRALPMVSPREGGATLDVVGTF